MKLLDRTKRVISRLYGVDEQVADQIYTIGDFQLTLPSSHMLPVYQAQNRLYDRFLPFLGRINVDGWVIDVGANIGDSAAAIASGPPKKILCVEPSPFFGRYLNANAHVIRRNGSDVRIAAVAVSSRDTEVILSESSSTSTRGSAGPPVPAVTLDALAKSQCGGECVAFIKSDVDGYDGDVLLSGISTISRDRPSLFFECDIRSAQEINSFMKLFEILLALNYEIMCLDNFGLPLCIAKDGETCSNILTYLVRQGACLSTRTFYYIDCFACTNDNGAMLDVYKSYLTFIDGS